MLVKAMFDENDNFYSITDIEMMGRTGETFSGKRPKQTMIYYSPENEQSARHTTSVKDKMIHGSVRMGIVFICWSDSSLYALLLYVSNTSI